MRNRRPLAGKLLVILIIVGLPLVFPWAFHMGGRWTPLLTWCGSGQMLTKGGKQYPVFLCISPASHFSRLRLDGRRPAGGLQGSGCICSSTGVLQNVKLSGTIYGAWWSTEGALIAFRVLERTIVDVGQKRAGYFDLVGSWQGGDLVLSDRGAWSAAFRSGLRIEQASVVLHWSSHQTCAAACEDAAR